MYSIVCLTDALVQLITANLKGGKTAVKAGKILPPPPLEKPWYMYTCTCRKYNMYMYNNA